MNARHAGSMSARHWIAGMLTACALAEPTVIVLSWDGVRHDYPDVARDDVNS